MNELFLIKKIYIKKENNKKFLFHTRTWVPQRTATTNPYTHFSASIFLSFSSLVNMYNLQT